MTQTERGAHSQADKRRAKISRRGTRDAIVPAASKGNAYIHASIHSLQCIHAHTGVQQSCYIRKCTHNQTHMHAYINAYNRHTSYTAPTSSVNVGAP